jgi:hypothetical protein
METDSTFMVTHFLYLFALFYRGGEDSATIWRSCAAAHFQGEASITGEKAAKRRSEHSCGDEVGADTGTARTQDDSRSAC